MLLVSLNKNITKHSSQYRLNSKEAKLSKTVLITGGNKGIGETRILVIEKEGSV